MQSIAFPFTALGVLAVLIVYVIAIRGVGKMRGKHGIKVPAMSGHEEFDRALRAQMNTLEYMVIFLPLCIIFAGVFGDLAGGIYGAVFAIGRYMYVTGYVRAPEKRVPGFMISAFATLSVLIACLGAVSWQLLS
ncbi:MAPEG family protein [Pacificimonas sp. WHA3]|uniref:MAPEG family protein n=1 Tax=Pacificimonas pallii TaxID=2827236 RepID=A0ABS6SD49_9SPHN|nr:MAPEG family protein [Pacificimonas pallii]MBV7256344.1 MAPEG family protein [Pacificimonas pallii]